MTKKNIALVTLAAVLACLYVRFFTDWFAPENIQIYHTVRPERPDFKPRPGSWQSRSRSNPVMFGFNQKLELTSIKVIPVSEIETNKYPHPIWHLVSDSNSVPTKSFVYGNRVRGMRPEVKGAQPEPLEPGVRYRLIIESGTVTGEHDFSTTPKRVLR